MTKTTGTMDKALGLALRNGGVFAGNGNVYDDRGHTCSVAAVTLVALERRGLVSVRIGPDGGMMACLTDTGRVLAGGAK